MRFLLTLLALIAGLATPGVTLATARAQVAGSEVGAEQVETSGVVAQAAASVATTSQRPPAALAIVHDLPAPVMQCTVLSRCSIALSDRPLE